MDQPWSQSDPVPGCSALPERDSVGQELAQGPGNRESPGGGGDNGGHSVDSGASAPGAS